jgi:hypothetical protein
MSAALMAMPVVKTLQSVAMMMVKATMEMQLGWVQWCLESCLYWLLLEVYRLLQCPLLEDSCPLLDLSASCLVAWWRGMASRTPGS